MRQYSINIPFEAECYFPPLKQKHIQFASALNSLFEHSLNFGQSSNIVNPPSFWSCERKLEAMKESFK